MATDGWGVDDGWTDTAGTWHPAPETTLRAIADAIGRGDAADPPGRPVWIVRPGTREVLQRPCGLALEDGTSLGVVRELPPDLPLGLHLLTPDDGGPPTTLIVSPGRCHLPEGLRAWGLTVQVPTARSSAGWGIGDLADVRSIASWVLAHGGDALALSPLHAPTPVMPIEPSPYYPSSRRWRSPLLIRVDDVPGAADDERVAALRDAARAASAGPVIDRDAVWARQRAALEHLWARRSDRTRDELAAWRATQGDDLEGWATYCALADIHGPRWPEWPSALRRPDSPAAQRAADDMAEAVAFHAWLQLLVARALDAARVGDVRLIQDLAIGTDPAGADAWLHQDLLALEMSVGAPPDDFAPNGQSWGLPPFVPWKLRDAGYRPFADLVRASMSRGGGLRVDHVMGLERLFWIPAGADPVDGTYVRHRPGELLEVLAMESARAEALVIGEDLGTVEHGFRDSLHERGVLSTRLVWFEDVPPTEYPAQAAAMVTTHDLPTIAGVWTGADEAELEQLGRPTPDDERSTILHRLDRLVELPRHRPVGEVIDVAHQRLGEGSAALALATAEDLCAVPTRPNVPGTNTERSNWSQALPLPVEELVTDPAVAEHLEALATGRRD